MLPHKSLTRVTILPLGKTKADMQNLANAVERHARDGYLPLSLAHIPSKDGLGAIFAVMANAEPTASEPEAAEPEVAKVAEAQTVVQHLDASGLPVPEIIPAAKPETNPDPVGPAT